METGMWVPKFETLPELLHYRSARVSQEGVASHQHIKYIEHFHQSFLLSSKQSTLRRCCPLEGN